MMLERIENAHWIYIRKTEYLLNTAERQLKITV